MKRKLIALCISSLLVGSGIVFNMNQDVSVPTVEKFTEDTSLSVSKHEAIVSEHENVDKDEKTGAGDTMKKPESKQEPVVEPTPAPEPARPGYACPGGVNPDVSCDVILDTNFYFEIYGSQSEADAAGMYYLDEVMYIGEIEITNYSVQPVYRNDHSIAYYGLNLWSNGNLVQ